MTPSEKDVLYIMRDTWDSLAKESAFNYVSHLQNDSSWDLKEFHAVGIRFVEQMMARYGAYKSVHSADATVLEIGCGIGRFLKILACRFQHVIGVDISSVMLENAHSYCSCMPNIEYRLTEGSTLNCVADASVDFVVSAGVFQHIISREVILSYIKEALRVLKPSGLFLFQFEGTRVHTMGKGQHGARIDAQTLTSGLQGCHFTIREISCDLRDPIRNMVVVLQKTKDDHSAQKDFTSFPMTPTPWLIGVYDTVQTKTNIHERLKQTPAPLTFYSQRESSS